MKHERHLDVLNRLLDPSGKVMIDVGCGDGGLCRRLAEAGANMTGLEIDADKVAKAEAKDPDGLATYRVALGESLPFEDGTLDAVLFFNSLHHVPVDSMDQALSEALRILKPGGIVCAVEPVAEGPHFEMMQPIHDETIVRAEAQAALDRFVPKAASHQATGYVSQSRYRDADQVLAKLVAIDPGRKAQVDEKGPALAAAFDELGETGPKGVSFDQPMLARLLTKA